MSIAKFQEDFINNLLLRSTAEEQSEFAKKIKNQVQLQNRYAIYRNNYLHFHYETLLEIFSTLTQILQEDSFRKIAVAYIKQVKMKSANIYSIGADFPSYIQKLTKKLEIDFLPEIALLDWYIYRASTAKDTQALDINALEQQTQDPQLEPIFHLNPSLILFRSESSIFSIWKNNQENSANIDLAHTKEREHICIWKKDLEVQIETISYREYRLLQIFQKNIPLSKVCEECISLNIELSDYLQSYIQKNWLASFSMESIHSHLTHTSHFVKNNNVPNDGQRPLDTSR